MQVIFSLYISIPDENLDKGIGVYKWDTLEKSVRSKINYEEYHDRILENHEKYAETINVKYVHHKRDHEYETFLAAHKSMYPFLSEYLIVNFYKLHLMEKYAKDYDEVMYVDFDVVFQTEENVFDAWDTSKGVCLWAECWHEDINKVNLDEGELNLRSMQNKHLICQAMHMQEFTDFTYPVMNTGIVLASAEHIKQIAFMDNLHHSITKVNEAREDEMFTEKVRARFDWNNEPIYAYRMERAGVPYQYMNGKWNELVRSNETQELFDSMNLKIAHMITKRFDWIWQ